MGANVIAMLKQIVEDEAEKSMDQAKGEIEERLEKRMRDSIDSIVYSTPISGDFDRTEAYKSGWHAVSSGGGLNFQVKMEYEPTGYHPSVNGLEDVTAVMDQIVIEGSGPAVESPANFGRDHFTKVDNEAEQLVDEVISQYLG